MAYLGANRWVVVGAVYILVAVCLYHCRIADIFPPCVISKIIGRPCPGCGLTRAGLSILRLDFRTAWSFNPTIFLVVPAMLYFLAADIRRFYRRRASRGIQGNG